MNQDVYFNSSDLIVPIHTPLIGINYCQGDYYNIREISDISVIGYVLNGQGTIHVDSLTFHPKQGDVFILPKSSYHKVYTNPNLSEEWTYMWYNIRGNSTHLLSAFHLQSTFFVPDAPLEHLFRQGFQIVKEKKETLSNEQLHIQLLLAVTEILANIANILERRKSLHSLKVLEMKHYLDQLAYDEFDSEQMCKHFGLSFKQINRIFKKDMGTTVYNYLMVKKIKTAKMLLEDTEMSVGEIASYIGYADAHYFSSIFKEKTGYSPTEYQENFGLFFKKDKSNRYFNLN